MKRYTKFSFLLLTVLGTAQLFAQVQPPQPDEVMDIFLRTVALIAICVMFGAAIVGAFAAAFVIGLIALFGGLGLVSISFVVGLHRRSLAAGFKTFIALFFACIGIITGTVAGIVLQQTMAPNLSTFLMLSLGFFTGALGGLLIGFASFKMIRIALAYAAKRITG